MLHIEQHTHSICEAFHKNKDALPPMPHLRTLRCPLDVHGIVLDPDGLVFTRECSSHIDPSSPLQALREDEDPEIVAERSRCAFHNLRFSTLIHDQVTWFGSYEPILLPPPDKSFDKHILLFNSLIPPQEFGQGFREHHPLFDTWLYTGENPKYADEDDEDDEDERYKPMCPQIREVVFVIPTLTPGFLPKLYKCQAEERAMYDHAHLLILALENSKRLVTMVGGIMDPNSVEALVTVEHTAGYRDIVVPGPTTDDSATPIYKARIRDMTMRSIEQERQFWGDRDYRARMRLVSLEEAIRKGMLEE